LAVGAGLRIDPDDRYHTTWRDPVTHSNHSLSPDVATLSAVPRTCDLRGKYIPKTWSKDVRL
jgi:hypothetical protein